MAAAVVGVASLAALPAGAAARERPLEVRDGALRDERGREVVLHGVNVAVGRAPWIPAAGDPEARSFDSATHVGCGPWVSTRSAWASPGRA